METPILRAYACYQCANVVWLDLAQILGGAALLVGLYCTAQTLRTTQEGQITDRFFRPY